MKFNSFSTFVIDIIFIIVVELILNENVVSAKIRIVTPKWNFKCIEGPGAFPHESDCQRQDDKTIDNKYST